MEISTSQSLINQGNILTWPINNLTVKLTVRSQSLINQGNILTKIKYEFNRNKIIDVAIPYKSGKYSYIHYIRIQSDEVFAMSQSLINQGNILTFYIPEFPEFKVPNSRNPL